MIHLPILLVSIYFVMLREWVTIVKHKSQQAHELNYSYIKCHSNKTNKI